MILVRNEIFGYKQSKAIEYGLSIEELLILKHFEDFVASGDAEQEYDAETNQVFYWVFYDKFIEDIPIINISKSRLGEIFVHNLCSGIDTGWVHFAKCQKRWNLNHYEHFCNWY